MKAIFVREFGGPEVLKLEDVLAPRTPQSGEVLVSVKAAGVNPYDTFMLAGVYGARNPALRYTPVSDAAGVVQSAGADLNMKVGDRVYISGLISSGLRQASRSSALPEAMTARRAECAGETWK